jgi:hypothetical protein
MRKNLPNISTQKNILSLPLSLSFSLSLAVSPSCSLTHSLAHARACALSLCAQPHRTWPTAVDSRAGAAAAGGGGGGQAAAVCNGNEEDAFQVFFSEYMATRKYMNRLRACMFVYTCVRERERERERGHQMYANVCLCVHLHASNIVDTYQHTSEPT